MQDHLIRYSNASVDGGYAKDKTPGTPHLSLDTCILKAYYRLCTVNILKWYLIARTSQEFVQNDVGKSPDDRRFPLKDGRGIDCEDRSERSFSKMKVVQTVSPAE